MTIALEGFIGDFAIAVNIMKYCGYVHADMIPMRIFAPLFASERELLKVMILLSDNKLVKMKIDANETYIFVHRVVQAIMRQKTHEDGEEISYITCLLDLAYRMMEDGSIVYDKRKVVQKNAPMLSHALALLKSGNAMIKAYPNLSTMHDDQTNAFLVAYARIGLVTCRYYFTIADHDKATLYGDMVEQLLQPHGDFTNAVVSELLALATYWVARAIYDQAKYDDSMIKFNESSGRIKQRSNINDDNKTHHAIIANCTVMIANVYYSQGKYDLALEKHNESLLIMEAIYGHDHPDVTETTVEYKRDDKGNYVSRS
jgi:tetratricopeptide (TPR) repeat protein